MSKNRNRNGRRAYLKYYSMRSASDPNPIFMQEYKNRQANAASNPLHVGPGTFKEEKAELWQGVRFQGFERINKVCLKSTRLFRLWHCFSGPHHFFFYEDLRFKQEKRSIVYPSRTIALNAEKYERIVWVETAPSPS